jgi:predicted nuclease of predicted toxin-antitoxin system
MRLLLDAHLSPAIARQLQREGVDAVALRDWLGGSHRQALDDQILAVAASDQRVLVTYDRRTIPPLLKEWAETSQQHAGVVLVDEQTLQPADIGGLLRALRALVAEHGDDDWQDRVIFLRARAAPA